MSKIYYTEYKAQFNYIKTLIKNQPSCLVDYDDLIQELEFCIFKLKKENPDKIFNKSYIATRLRWMLNNYLREKRRKNAYEISSDNDEHEEVLFFDLQDRRVNIENLVVCRELLTQVKSILEDEKIRIQDIFINYMCGTPQTVLVKKYNTDAAVISKTIKKMKQKILKTIMTGA